jgi:chromosome segregation ATPase
MTVQLLTRRSLVVAGAVAALVVGAASIRVAAAWSAASAPLNDPPASLASVQASLDQERARSAALDEQLRILEGASSDLAAALESAQGQVATDAASAEELRTSLAAAKDKLARLEAALAGAARARAATSTTTVWGRADQEDREDEEEDREDEDHEDEPDDD